MYKSWFKRIFRWILFVALLGIGLAAALAGYYVWQANQARDDLVKFIATHPDSAAIVVYTVDGSGSPIEDRSAVFCNADQPLVVASTMKVVVLAAYADAVSQDALDANERIPVDDWERWYLPGTDGGAHVNSLASLGLAADDLGFARDQAATVSLDDLARIMIHYSGNAATDYLIARLGPDKLAEIMSDLGLEHHTPLGPTLGAALATFNHENASFAIERLEPLVAAVSAGNTSDLDRMVDLYLGDEDWRTAQIEFMTSLAENQNLNAQEMWAYQVKASQLLPKGTAKDYARLMGLIANGKLISSETSALMQQKLETIPADWPMRLLFHHRFGAKDGATAGVVALASYAVPKHGDLVGQTRVVVILANEQPLESWSDQIQYQGYYLLQADLASGTKAVGPCASSE